jgi:hypothetical protein
MIFPRTYDNLLRHISQQKNKKTKTKIHAQIQTRAKTATYLLGARF